MALKPPWSLSCGVALSSTLLETSAIYSVAIVVYSPALTGKRVAQERGGTSASIVLCDAPLQQARPRGGRHDDELRSDLQRPRRGRLRLEAHVRLHRGPSEKARPPKWSAGSLAV